MTFATLADYADINPSARSIDRSRDELVSFVPMAAVSEQGQLVAQEKRRLTEVTKGYTCFERSDVLLAKITPCMENGKAALLHSLETRCGFGSTEFHVLRARPGVDPRFLFYLVWNQTFRDEAAKHMTGTAGQKRVPASYLKQLKVPRIAPSDQRRIADIFDKADAIRRKRREAIALTEELLRSAFLEMFGDPVTNLKGWEVKALGDVVQFTTGKLDSNAAVSNGDYPFFTCSRETSRIDTYAFDCEALLLAGNNATADYSVKRYSGRFNAYQRTYVITRRSQDWSYGYLRQALEFKLAELKRKSKGTSTKYLTLGILLPLHIVIPARSEQQRFEAFDARVSKLRVQLTSAECEAERLFESLVQRAFNGELSRQEDNSSTPIQRRG